MFSMLGRVTVRKVFQQLRDYLKSHCLPDGHLSHGLEVYLNLLKSEAHQPKGEKRISDVCIKCRGSNYRRLY